MIIDNHSHLNSWGIHPVLFELGPVSISSYSFFVLLGLAIGCTVFYFNARKYKMVNERSFYVFVAAVVGGILGAKIPVWIVNYKNIIENFPDMRPVLYGRTITGGLIGGTLSVILTKRFLGIKGRKGNIFAPSIALGISVGRIGCFLRGCCYGKPTSLPWGVDFGDGVLRQPTQLYESIFTFYLFVRLQYLITKKPEPGALFDKFLKNYFIFRFFIEFFRVNEGVFAGLTGFQITSLLVLMYLYGKDILVKYKKEHNYE